MKMLSCTCIGDIIKQRCQMAFVFKAKGFALLLVLLFIFVSWLPCDANVTTTTNITTTGTAVPLADKSSEISIAKFLCTAFVDPTLSAQSERIHFLKQTPGGISFIEDPEFRISIDQFESNQQKYTLRFKPRGWDEIKSEEDVHNAMLQSGTAELDSLFHMALKNRYLTVVDFLYFSEMTTLHEELNLLYEDWESVLKRHVDTPDFDPGELADMENLRIALQVDLMELKNQKRAVTADIKEKREYSRQESLNSGLSLGAPTSLRNGIPLSDSNSPSPFMERGLGGEVNGAEISLDGSRMITMEQISDRISGMLVNREHENNYLKNAERDVATAEAEYRLEVAEKNRIITFVETAYNAADEEDFDDAFSIEFGFSIPIGSGSETKLRQQKLESMKSRSDRNALEREINHTIPVIQQKLHNRIAQYTAVKKKKEEGFAPATFDRLLQMEGTDPLTLLRLRKGMFKNDILLAKLSRMIRTTYINLLDITGILSEKPLINHLADHKEGIVQ
ncbi:hypothetical protein MTBBW1_410050 [Desulfamplus magnetovallimortis]|uniref:TolC family protein n=1 Tax=Desulfamplus magnetovallimortis TaxID=1246637 RepID=A0A1W1HH07_9BACT|nr:hypothetical protein [Desulfamplus magnetovallimortis]SLM31695.1 hypothetical protein MTBBW1_410050 [Desulfamplus magnetovallimortis]